jgi:hypothetical protein
MPKSACGFLPSSMNPEHLSYSGITTGSFDHCLAHSWKKQHGLLVGVARGLLDPIVTVRREMDRFKDGVLGFTCLGLRRCAMASVRA